MEIASGSKVQPQKALARQSFIGTTVVFEWANAYLGKINDVQERVGQQHPVCPHHSRPSIGRLSWYTNYPDHQRHRGR